MALSPYLFRQEHLRDSDRIIILHDDGVLVTGESFAWHRHHVDPHFAEDHVLLLVEDGEQRFVAVQGDAGLASSLDAESRSLRSLLFSEGEYPFSIAGKAAQILDWYSSHRYCGSCGSQTVHHDRERALSCPACHKHFYPRINPCAIMLVVDGERMLLARHARNKSGFFSCLAGFIEVGETPEETVHREVMEEVAIEVENVRYLKSQSWPFPSQLMLGYIADYKSGSITPQEDEIAEARWFHVDESPTVPSAKISVAGELIQYYVNEVKAGEL